MTGKQLKKRRKALNIRAIDLAKRVGVKKSNFSAMESGKRPIGSNMAARITKALESFKTEQKAVDAWWKRTGKAQVFNAPHLVALRADSGRFDG